MLNQGQQQIFDAVIKQGLSACVCSAAGSGKSYLLERIVDAMEAKGYTTLPCACTGRAASKYPMGVTVHRAANLGTGASMTLPPGVATEPRLWQGVRRRPFDTILANCDKRWRSRDLLCTIDEFYQLNSEDLNLWYAAGMAIRDKLKLPPPIFVFVGDVGQFLPVSGSLAFERARYDYYDQQGNIASVEMPSILEQIEPSFWNLVENMRQSDPQMRKALNWLYWGIAVHPAIRERVTQAPVGTPTYYYNNIMVADENARLLQKYKSAPSRRYHALTETLTTQEEKYLLPVTPQMDVYVGAPFTLTLNVPDTHGNLLVANGQVTTVVGLGNNSIKVETSEGEKIDLHYAAHYLPYNPANGKRKSCLMLPGYVGAACSIMKVQGDTLDRPVKFACWQLQRGKFASFKNLPGALYTICSRPVDLSLLYFDLSLGVDLTKSLINDSLSTSSKVLDFLLQGRRPLWATDAVRQQIVVEFVRQVPNADKSVWLLEFTLTSILNGAESTVVAAFTAAEPPIYLAAARVEQGTPVEDPSLNVWAPQFERVASNWAANKKIDAISLAKSA